MVGGHTPRSDWVRRRAGLGVLLATLGAGAPAWAEALQPLRYVFDRQTDTGTYSYHDGHSFSSPAYTELTDGLYGLSGWAVDQGQGPAAPWVGWYGDPVVHIDFSFGQQVWLSEVRVGSTQNRLDDVVLPSVSLSYWREGAWVPVASLDVPEDAANNWPASSVLPHGFLTLGGLAVQADTFRLTLRHALDGPWIFVDEVDFDGSVVPEVPAMGLMLPGLALVGLARRRRLRP